MMVRDTNLLLSGFALQRMKPCLLPRRHFASRGFTLVELVTVITILGILSAFALPRFLQTSAFESRTIQDQLIRAAQEAQQLAMHKGTGANVQLQVDDGNKRIRIQYTDSGLQIRDTAIPSDITLSNATINYNTLGDAVPVSTIVITGDSVRQVCIESTGYAHTC